MQKVPFGSQANSLSTDPFLNKPESSSKGKFNFSRVIELYRTLKPLSLPNTDSSGNIIQLWKVDQQGFLLGSVIDKTGQLKLIPSHKITHPLGGEFQKDELIKRLERFHPRQWSFVFDPIKLELVVWPRLIAAGHGDIGQVDTYIAKLDSKTLSAALREKNGEIVKFKTSGESYDHQTKVDKNKKGLERHIKALETKLADSQLSTSEHERINLELSRSKSLLKHVNASMYFNYKAYRLGVNSVNSAEERTKAVLKKYSELFKRLSPSPDKGPDGGGGKGGRPLPTPGRTHFIEVVQKNHLTSSYNTTHADHPIPAKGAMSGEIGGVGGRTELIQGLFDSPEALFENHHVFCLPTLSDGQVPMTDSELQQILRELTIGIYVYDTVPFFSLHFNQNSDLYPVIHPAYENTLVGQVISLLDYFMKGYLNGGIFKEEFLRKWEEDPSWERKKDSALQQMIDFTTYCHHCEKLQGMDKRYISLRQMLDLSTHPELLKELQKTLGKTIESMIDSEPAVLRDPTLFSNSFRIIAKQNHIQKTENLFVLEPDFDVFYTINPSPAYKQALDQYQKIHGKLPHSYQLMVEAYENMKQAIHDHMVKIPFCSNYFAMLGVINFFCSYLMTLKKHRKIPIFLPIQPAPNYGSPALFPHLPLEHLKKEALKANFSVVVKEFCSSHKNLLIKYVNHPTDAVQTELLQTLEKLIKEHILTTCSAVMRRHLEKNSAILQSDLSNIAKSLLESMKENSAKLLEELKKEIQDVRHLPILSQEEIRQQFNLYDRIRNSPSILFEVFAFTRAFFDEPERVALFRKIRGMTAVEYQEISDATLHFVDENSVLRNLKEQDLLGFVIENRLWRIFENQDQDILLMTKGILHVKPEVPLTTIEKGKRIVGGCGMSLTPMKVSPSLKGEIILQEYGSLVQQLEPEKLTSIGTESGSGLQGAIFKLMFEDLPPEMKEDYTWMENLFFASNQEMIQMSLAMQQLSEAITQNDVPTFNKFMQDSSAHLSQMRDRHGATLLHVAAMQKNPYYIQELVKKGLSTTIPDKKRYLPIHYAAMYGNKDVITFLLSANPSTINAESHDKSTPLVVAIQNGQEVIVKFLLHQKAAYDTITSAGYTPLHCALHHGHEAIAKALLEQPGIDVNRQTEEGVTPLMLACEIDSEKLVEVLLHKGARPDVERKDGITALDIAVKRNCFTVCKVLSRIAKLSNFTIELAVKESSMDILQLLSSKPNFLTYRNYAKDTPLILAIRWGHIPAALHIIDVMTQVADFNAENVFGESPISLSAACGFTQLIEAMINKRAVVRPKELLKKLCRLDISPFLTHYISTVQLSADDLQELLLVAAEAGQPIIIRNLLLPRQVNLDALQSPKKWKIEHYLVKSDGIFLFKQRVLKSKDYLNRLMDEGGKSLAYLAAENGSWRCFKFLLDQMVKNNIPLEDHYLTHHLAYAVIEYGDLDGVRLMCNSIQDPSLLNRDLDGKGTTAVHIAAKIGSRDILHFLQSQGAKMDQEDKGGKTPLYYAIQCHSKQAVKFLLSERCKAKITAEALYLAFSLNLSDILKLLIESGAQVDVRSTHTHDTPLLLAIKNHDETAFNALVKMGASLDCTNHEGWTPTLLASDTGQYTILEAILRLGYVDRSFYKGNHALHLACKKGHPECMKLLIQAGFSPHEPNGENKTAESLVQGSMSGLAALGVNDAFNTQLIRQLSTALEKGKLEDIQKGLHSLSANETISIQWENKKISGSLLHLILRIAPSTYVKPIVDRILQDPQLNIDLRDHRGCSYAHLLVRAGIQPGNLPLNVVDHEGATPLHYAVSNCDETFLLELLKSREAKKSINVADRKGRTPLFYAIIAKRIKNIEILLEHGADPNHINSFLITPLILACEEGFFPAVRMLIEAGANIDKRGTLEWLTPLFVSLGIENEEVSLYLLMSGANGQAKMRDGSTIAHAAAQSDKVSILRILSNQGISLNEPNLQGVRPIHLASQQGHHRILEYLLSEDISLESEVELPVTPSPSGELGWATMKGAKPIHFASMAGKIETVQWLLEHYANPESKFHNEFGVLNGAAQANSLSLIEQFKQYKLSQDINQLFSAITTAIQYDHVESVQMLYEIGIPINSEIIDGWNGLHLACKFGSVRTTHALLDQGAIPDIPNREGNQAIQVAASNNSVDQFWHMLIRSKADLNAVNGKGETLLHIAVKSGRLAHAMLLVHYGAPLDIQDHRGETPLHIAVKKGHLKLIGLLIGCGADSAKKTFMDEKTALELSTHPDISELIKRYDAIKAAAQGEETVLHLAIRAKLIEAVRVLCVDSDLNQRNSSGLTALHLAVEAESFSIVRMLLSRGADLEAEDNQGHTPLWKACLDKRHVLLTRILIKAGANRNHRNKSGQTIAHILNGMDFQEKNHMLELLKTE